MVKHHVRATEFLRIRIRVALLCFLCMSASADDVLVRVARSSGNTAASQVSGRILLTAQDGGILLEEPSGTIHNLTPDQFDAVTETDQPFVRLNADGLSSHLLNTMGQGFATRTTEHYVICSVANDSVTNYVGELLEEVYSRYFEFFDDGDTSVSLPDGPLAVIVFDSVEGLKEHAGQLHPEISFDDIPGFYSSRSNQMYVHVAADTDSRRRLLNQLREIPRVTETIVHEAVHQLGYNSGLHSRFADNPLWFTEGIALYFEPSSGRGRLLWSGPGRTNSFHAARLKALVSDSANDFALADLLRDNDAFLSADSVAAAYALSWGLMYHLLHRDRPAFDRIAAVVRDRRPLIEAPAEDELAQFEAAAAVPLAQFERQMRQTVRKLRIRQR